MMSEKRFHQFGLWVIDNPNFNGISIADLVDTELMSISEVVNLLNEQQATIRKLQDLCGKSDYENVKLRQEIKELKAQLREKEEDERLYANEIVKLNKEAKEVLDFKSLGGDY